MLKVVEEFALMRRTYLKGGYPPFIYSRNYQGYLPAFFYHNVDPFDFERQLTFLRNNGYSTVSCDEAVEIIQHNCLGNSKVVLLTFDDGLASFYSLVFPLLLKFQMKAVAYLAPAWIDQPGFLTWAQCREMSKSGLVDFQSHSLTHPKVITQLRINSLRSTADKEPLWDIPGFKGIDRGQEPGWLPVFEGASAFKGSPAYSLPDRFWDEVQLIQRQVTTSTTRKFNRLQLARLKQIYSELLKQYSSSICEENEKSMYSTMLKELQESKYRLEQQLPGHKVRHFAFPWHENSKLAWLALENSGYRSGATGLELPDSHGESPGSTLRVSRVKGDFLQCLHGEGHKGFFRIVMKKVVRRLYPANN